MFQVATMAGLRSGTSLEFFGHRRVVGYPIEIICLGRKSRAVRTVANFELGSPATAPITRCEQHGGLLGLQVETDVFVSGRCTLAAKRPMHEPAAREGWALLVQRHRLGL